MKSDSITHELILVILFSLSGYKLKNISYSSDSFSYKVCRSKLYICFSFVTRKFFVLYNTI